MAEALGPAGSGLLAASKHWQCSQQAMMAGWGGLEQGMNRQVLPRSGSLRPVLTQIDQITSRGHF